MAKYESIYINPFNNSSISDAMRILQSSKTFLKKGGMISWNFNEEGFYAFHEKYYSYEISVLRSFVEKTQEYPYLIFDVEGGFSWTNEIPKTDFFLAVDFSTDIFDTSKEIIAQEWAEIPIKGAVYEEAYMDETRGRWEDGGGRDYFHDEVYEYIGDAGGKYNFDKFTPNKQYKIQEVVHVEIPSKTREEMVSLIKAKNQGFFWVSDNGTLEEIEEGRYYLLHEWYRNIKELKIHEIISHSHRVRINEGKETKFNTSPDPGDVNHKDLKLQNYKFFTHRVFRPNLYDNINDIFVRTTISAIKQWSNSLNMSRTEINNISEINTVINEFKTKVLNRIIKIQDL